MTALASLISCPGDTRAVTGRARMLGSVLGSLAVAGFFVSCIWYDVLHFYAGLDIDREVIFAVALVAAAGSAACRGWHPWLTGSRSLWLIPAWFAAMIALHLATGLPPAGKNVSMLVAPIAGFLLLACKRRQVLWLTVGTVACSTLIQAQEFYSLSYLYVWKDQFITHTAEMYMATQGLFRAKGLFAGPLNGYDLGLLALLFSEFSPFVIAFVSLGAALAATKSGILASAGAIILRGVRRPRPWVTLALATVLSAAYLVGVQALRLHVGTVQTDSAKTLTVSRQNLVEYLLRAADPAVPSTADRIASIRDGLQNFLAFSPFHIAFGDPNFSYRMPAYLDRGIESSIEKELQDYGILGFLLAVGVKLATLVSLARRSPKLAIGFAGYLTIASVSPVFTPLGFDVLLWLFMLGELQLVKCAITSISPEPPLPPAATPAAPPRPPGPMV
jgi:hypothetical protein